MVKVAFLVAGVKGCGFFRAVHDAVQVDCVSSYQPAGTLDTSFNDLAQFCRDRGYRFVPRADLEPSVFEHAELVCVAGWQYLLRPLDDRLVIFHDSLLPKFRGFAPTVSALIKGEGRIGVTALQAGEVVDEGAIYGQGALQIEYPAKVQDVYARLATVYGQLALDLFAHYSERGSLPAPTAQDANAVTWSLWRDEDDYFVDWNRPAAEIRRLVDAVGWPYSGARTYYDRTAIVIDEVEEVPDLRFEARHFGKIWQIGHNQPVVVCGHGMLRIMSARTLSTGEPAQFPRLRVRMGELRAKL